MSHFFRKLLLLFATLGLGALAYGLLRADEEGPREAPAGSPPDRPEPEAPPPVAEPAGAVARCEGVTQSGRRCAREAQPGSRFCWQHGG